MIMKLRQFVVENYRVSLHYKAGITKVALESVDNHFTVHCYCTQVEDMREAFILYQAYSRFVESHYVYVLLNFAIHEHYGVEIVGCYLDELISEIQTVVQQMKEVQADEKH